MKSFGLSRAFIVRFTATRKWSFVPSAVRLGTDRLLCCLIVGIHASGMSIPMWVLVNKLNLIRSVPRRTAYGTTTRIEIVQERIETHQSNTNQHKPRCYLYCNAISRRYRLMKTNAPGIAVETSIRI